MQRRNKPGASKFANIYTISPKINRYFGTLWDTSTFKRTFYSILDAERSARGFQLRIKPSGPKFANTSSILTKMYRYFGTFCDISTFKRTFYTILDAECSAHYMQGRDKHRSSKFATISSILTKIYRYFGLARDISSFKRTFYSILYADRSGRGFQLGN